MGPIHRPVQAFQTAAQPVISVDTPTQEWVGHFNHQGRELRPKGAPERVRVHDVARPELGKVAPYGVYDPTPNTGWVKVGTDHETAACAVASSRRWWPRMGQQTSPQAQRLLMTADSGGSHGSRTRRWKPALQQLAHATGLESTVCPRPPGTSQWHKMAHRLLSYISQHGRGKPRGSHQGLVNLMAATTTRTGLTVRCALDPHPSPKGIHISDTLFKPVNSSRDSFHGEWHDTITPNAS